MNTRTDSELTTQLQQENADLKNKLSALEAKIDAVSKENALLRSSVSDIDAKFNAMRTEIDIDFKPIKKENKLLALKFAAYQLKQIFETERREDVMKDRIFDTTHSCIQRENPLIKVLESLEKMEVDDFIQWYPFFILKSNYLKYKEPDTRGFNYFSKETQLLKEILSLEQQRNPKIMDHWETEYEKNNYAKTYPKYLEGTYAAFFASKRQDDVGKKHPEEPKVKVVSEIKDSLPEQSKAGSSEVKSVPQGQHTPVKFHL